MMAHHTYQSLYVIMNPRHSRRPRHDADVPSTQQVYNQSKNDDNRLDDEENENTPPKKPVGHTMHCHNSFQKALY